MEQMSKKKESTARRGRDCLRRATACAARWRWMQVTSKKSSLPVLMLRFSRCDGRSRFREFGERARVRWCALLAEFIG